MRIIKILFWILSGLLLVNGFGYAQTDLPATPATTVQPTVSEDYHIGKGDIIAIHVWKEPNLSAETFVRIDGKISLPLLSDLQAYGKSPIELKSEIEHKLQGFLENPMVTVIVKEPASQKFYILGEVEKTGEYPLTKDLTVLQALALAGGFSKWAEKSEIILLRKENNAEQITRINYKDILKGNDFSQNVLLKVNDTIIIP